MPSPNSLKKAMSEKIKQTDLLRMTGKTISLKFTVIVITAAVIGLSFVLLSLGGVFSVLQGISINVVLILSCVIFLLSLLMISNYHRRSVRRFITDAQNYIYEDPLTGISNFMKFQMDAEETIKKSHDKHWCIISIDINNFKYINDAYGYSVGDETLIYIAEALISILDENELCSRVGGDDFAILISYHSPEDLDRLFYKLRKKTKEAPICIRHKYCIKFSAGVYIVQPGDKISIAAMYDRARLAYESVRSNRSADYFIYTDELREQIHQEKQIEQEMYSALENGEFEIYLQPKWDIQNGDTIVGAETLVRWNSPTKGMLYPSDFLPVLEKNGFIVEVDRYIFELVCSYFRGRLDNMLPVVPLSVNVSEQDINQPDFVEFYIAMKNKYDIPDGLLQLEFTESIVYEDCEKISKMIRQLQKNGFNCSIDDFGKGNSSLNAIKDLPVDDLKLDMIFFRENNLHERTEAVVKSIISMAKALGMKTVAEGVESKNQVEFLRRIGCDEIQGYIFAKPMPARQMDDYINAIPKRKLLENTEQELVAARSQLWQDSFGDVRYLAALKFVDAIVTEIDLDLGVYHVVGDHSLSVKSRNGYYDQALRRTAAERIHPFDREKYLRMFSVTGIKSAFYRGEKRLSHRFRALDSRNREYIWFEMTVLRLESGEQNRAISFLRNVHFRKWMDKNGGEDRVRLAEAVLRLHSSVYELDLDALTYRRLDIDDEYKVTAGQYGDLMNQISNMIDENQRHAFAERFSPGNLRRLLTRSGANKPVQGEYRFYINKEYRWHSLTVVAERNNQNRLLAMCFVQDIHDNKRDVLDRNSKIEQLKTLIMSSFSEIVEVDLLKDTFIDISCELLDVISGNVQVYDKSFNGMFEVDGCYSKAFERMVSNYIHHDDRQRISRRFSKDALTKAMLEQGLREIADRCRIIKENGEYCWIRMYALAANCKSDESTIYLYCKLLDDISIESESFDNESERDDLTGLYNRFVFEQIVSRIADSKTNDEQHALLLVEVDNFTEITKKWGYMAGEEVLRSLAEMLNRSFRSEDVIGRIDNDRFAIFMKNIVSMESARKKADQVCRNFRGPLSGELINDIVTCSVGAAVSGRDGNSYKQLLSNAELALMSAKADGKSRVRLYSRSGQIHR
ncbi:MAG: EAL domain-containing protein [Eubacteriales bacterium]|jgi:diguanylate cyclase (GGDEF)-like protein